MPAWSSPGFLFAPAFFKRSIAWYVLPEFVGPAKHVLEVTVAENARGEKRRISKRRNARRRKKAKKNTAFDEGKRKNAAFGAKPLLTKKRFKLHRFFLRNNTHTRTAFGQRDSHLAQIIDAHYSS